MKPVLTLIRWLSGFTVLVAVPVTGAVASAAERADLPASASRNDRAPFVQFIQPTDGAYVRGRFGVLIGAEPKSRIEQVSVSQENEVVGIDLEPPFEVLWDTTAGIDGPHTLVAKVLDVDFHEASARIAVIVDNTPPTIVLIAPRDGIVTVGTVRLEAQASDVLGVQAVKFLVNGQVAGTASKPPYTFDWKTETVHNGRHTLQARAFDRAGNGVTTLPVAVQVANLNQYPVLSPIGSRESQENVALTFKVEGTDPDGARDPLIYHATRLPPWAEFNERTGEFRGTPGPDEASMEKNRKTYPAVRFEVCDPEPLCDSEEITITILDTDRPPVVGNPGSHTVKEDETLTFTITASDPDGDPITCKTSRLPRWSNFDCTTRTFTGLPGYDAASLAKPLAEYTVTFEFCDNTPLCTSQEVAVAVQNVNAAPGWNPIGDQAGEEGRQMEFEISATDSDGDTPILRALSLPDGARFTDRGGGVGRFTWTPRADQGGRQAATFSATDGELSIHAVVAIAVKERIRALSGLVVDEKDQPVKDVILRLTTQAGTIKTATTDAQGYYLMTNIQPGAYVVKPLYKSGALLPGVEERNLVFHPLNQRIEMVDSDERGVDFILKKSR